MGRLVIARVILWVGAVLPFIYTVPKSTSEIGSVGFLELIRGIGPLTAVILSVLIGRGLKRERKEKLASPELSLALFLLIAFISSLWSFMPLPTFLKAMTLTTTYLVLWRLTQLYDTPSQALKGLVTFAHTLLLVGAAQLVLFFLFEFDFENPAETRYSQLLPSIHSNMLGLVVGVAILGIILRVGPAWTLRPYFSISLAGLYGTTLLAAQSRMVTLVVGVMVLVALFVRATKSHRFARGLWVGIFASLIAAFLLKERIFEFIIRGQDSNGLLTLTGRTVIWERALKNFDGNPLLGYGYYSGHRLKLAAEDSFFSAFSNLDSTWLETYIDLGLLGLLPLAMFAVLGSYRVFRMTKCLPNSGERVFTACIILSALLMSFVNPSIQSISTAMIIFAFLVFLSRFSCEELTSNVKKYSPFLKSN